MINISEKQLIKIYESCSSTYQQGCCGPTHKIIDTDCVKRKINDLNRYYYVFNKITGKMECFEIGSD